MPTTLYGCCPHKLPTKAHTHHPHRLATHVWHLSLTQAAHTGSLTHHPRVLAHPRTPPTHIETKCTPCSLTGDPADSSSAASPNALPTQSV
eukprot:366577-Chlamydomonas_euryale.AAC.15